MGRTYARCDARFVHVPNLEEFWLGYFYVYLCLRVYMTYKTENFILDARSTAPVGGQYPSYSQRFVAEHAW